MNRRRRILLELLGPPPLATFMLALLAIAREPGGPWTWKHLGGFLAILAFAYLIAAIPCALFTLTLEVGFARGLDPGSWLSVLLASFLGLVSGMAMVGFDPSRGAFSGLAGLGLATGAVIGAFIRRRSGLAAARRQ